MNLEGKVTDEQIAEWKEKYGKVFKYEIDNKVAFVVSFGDLPKEAGAKAIAKLLVEAIQ